MLGMYLCADVELISSREMVRGIACMCVIYAEVLKLHTCIVIISYVSTYVHTSCQICTLLYLLLRVEDNYCRLE